MTKCPLCDQLGYRHGALCTHDPGATQRTHKGAAAARAALNRPPTKEAA